MSKGSRRCMAIVGTAMAVIFPAAAQTVATNGTLLSIMRSQDNFPQDGLGNGAYAGTYAGDNNQNHLSRLVALFELPANGGKGYRVQDAALSCVLKKVQDAGGNLPDLDVACINKGASSEVVGRDYEAAALGTLSSMATPATAIDSTLTWSNANLVAALNAAYSNGSTHVALRFQLAQTGDFYDGVNGYAVSDGDGAAEYYQVYYGDLTYADPSLTITLAPDPRPIAEATQVDFKRVVDTPPQDGTGDGAYIGSYCGDIVNNNFQHQVVTFELPEIDPTHRVDQAMFSALVQRVQANGNIVDLDVAFLDKGSSGTIVAGDYEAAAEAVLTSIGTPSMAEDTFVAWSNQDLADALNAAYSNGSTHVAFRFQLAQTGDFYDAVNGHPVSDGDGVEDTYRFYSDPAPTLWFYEYVPPEGPKGTVIVVR